MIALGVIPARYQSVRFPGKPLVDIKGKSMIQRVYEQAGRAQLLDRTIVATDDERIYEHCIIQGMEVQMTSSDHRSGTDRVAEVAQKHSASVIVNIQGDEPFLPFGHIDMLLTVMQEGKANLATLVTPIINPHDATDPNTVKVVRRSDGRALYFSRSMIPYARDPEVMPSYLHHLGVYAYDRDTLLEITKLPQGSLEKWESLEQLRWLEAGYDIQLVEVESGTIGIDSPQDLADIVAWMDRNGID